MSKHSILPDSREQRRLALEMDFWIAVRGQRLTTKAPDGSQDLLLSEGRTAEGVVADIEVAWVGGGFRAYLTFANGAKVSLPCRRGQIVGLWLMPEPVPAG